MRSEQYCCTRSAGTPRSPLSTPRLQSGVASESNRFAALGSPHGKNLRLEDLLLVIDDRHSLLVSDLKLSLEEMLVNHHRDLESSFLSSALCTDHLADAVLSKQTRLPCPPRKGAAVNVTVNVTNAASATISKAEVDAHPQDDESLAWEGSSGLPGHEGKNAKSSLGPISPDILKSSWQTGSSLATPIGRTTLQGSFAGREEHCLQNLDEATAPIKENHIAESVEQEIAAIGKVMHHVVKELEHEIDPDVDLVDPDVVAKGRVQQCLINVTESPAFQGIVAAAIFVNSILLGVIVHLDLMRAFRGEDSLPWEAVVEVVFMIIFTLEVGLRIAAERLVFFSGKHWRWNIFDFTVVMTTLLEYLAAEINVSALRVLRVLRMLRVMRVMRLMRFLRELRMMVCAILCSGASLFWAAMLITLSVYLFSVFLGEVLRTHLREAAVDQGEHAALMSYYDGMGVTMTMLVVALLGGNDWYDVAKPIMQVGGVYGMTFVLFVGFVTLGMLNVLTGIFVESASNISGMDAELVMEMELKEKDSRLAGLKRLFSELDKDKSNTLAWTELLSRLEDDRVVMHFQELDITTFHATRLFQLLDTDGSQVVGIEEFIDGCMRFRGAAKAIDLASIIYDSQRVNQRFDTKLEDLTDATMAQGRMVKELCDTFQKTVVE